MAGFLAGSNHIPLHNHGAADYYDPINAPTFTTHDSAGSHDAQFLQGGEFGVLDSTSTAPTYGSHEVNPNSASPTSLYDLLQEDGASTQRARVFQRCPTLTFIVTPALPSQVVELQYFPPAESRHESIGGPTNYGPTSIPPDTCDPTIMPFLPDMTIPRSLSTPTLHANTALDECNAPFNDDYSCPALDPTENFDFSFHPDDIDLNMWDVFDMPVGVASVFDVPLVGVMDTSNNPNALTHVVDQVPELEMVSDNLRYPQHQGLPLPISCPTQSNFMESMMYNRAVSDFAAMKMSAASVPTSSSSSYQISNLHQNLSAPTSPTSSVNMEAPLHHENFLYGVEDMGSVHGGNQAASTLKTRCYKVQDKFAWRKQVMKTKKQPIRSTSNHEDMNPVNDGIRVGFRLKTQNLNMDDGFFWHKYGQKEIIKHKHPRSYLRCNESARTGCTVIKHIQRCSDDEEYIQVIYFGRHNHSL